MPDGLRYGTDPKLERAWLTWYGKLGDANAYHLHHVKPWAYPDPNFWGPEVFGGWNLANPDSHLIITKATIGGASIDKFFPGNTGWDLMTENYAITQAERLAEGIPDIGPIDVLWWGQGEQLSIPAGNYYNDFTNLIAQIKAEFNSPDLKVVVMGLNKRFPSTHESDVAFHTYVADHPNDAVYVHTKDLHVRGDSGYEPENVHFSAKGLQELGYRMASATHFLLQSVPLGTSCAHSGIHSDGDGICDYCEYLADTDIFDANDYFHVKSVSHNGGMTAIHFDSSSNRVYSLEYRTNGLTAGSWHTNETRTGIGGADTFVFTPEPDVERTFVRLQVEFPQ